MRGIEISLYSNNVTLSVSVTDKLKAREDKFGHIQVSSGTIGAKECFWDNLLFFISADYETFRKECRKELREKGFKTKEVYKDIKILLKQAIKLKLLNT